MPSSGLYPSFSCDPEDEDRVLECTDAGRFSLAVTCLGTMAFDLRHAIGADLRDRLRIVSRVDFVLELPDPNATVRLGHALASVLQKGDVIFLEGPLGAGKTFLAQALARGLGVHEDEPITSPTFTLVQEWPTELPVLHADLYRLGDARELEELGIRERIFEDAALVVEWGERFASELSTDGLLLELSMREGDARGARLHAKGTRGEVLLEAARQAFAKAP